MEPWVKRMLVMPVVMLALICLVAAFGSAKAGNGGDRHGDSDQTETRFGLDYIPLHGGEVDMAVRSVVLHHNGKTYLLETSKGLEVKSQNRLPLARVPILGQLTDPPYERAAFASEHKVADVTADGERLFIDLPDSAELPGSVAIFNQNNAFFLKDSPVPHLSQIPLAGKQMASAYYHQDEHNLLIMVRPSIILDGGLF